MYLFYYLFCVFFDSSENLENVSGFFSVNNTPFSGLRISDFVSKDYSYAFIFKKS